MRTIRALDLFCGAGGSSTGLLQACVDAGCRLELTAINHWQAAVETHAANHPGQRHLCESMENLDPRKVWPARYRLDILWASPECTHHSIARGGRPISDQSRASAWHVVRWAEALRPAVVLVENVPEFQTWGPIGRGGRPIARLRGDVYLAWNRALQALGYHVDASVLNAADYGEATTRRRIFVQAWLRSAPRWPAPTHRREARIGLFGGSARWRPASEVIDFGLPSRSVFGRKKPLSERTMARIEEGMRRQGAAAAPFLVALRRHAASRALTLPLATLCARGGHFGLCEPFVLGQQSCAAPRDTKGPLPTVTGANRGEQALVQPFLTKAYGTGGLASVSDPLPTATARDRFGLVEQCGLDIHFRMLQPPELAAAMGFPRGYIFCGNKGEQVRQIGNAVSVRTARALCAEVLR